MKNCNFQLNWSTPPERKQICIVCITCSDACLTHRDLRFEVVFSAPSPPQSGVTLMLISRLACVLFSDMLPPASSSNSSFSAMELLSLKDTLRTRTGLGGTIRKGIPAKLSPTVWGISRSLESPLILLKLWVLELVWWWSRFLLDFIIRWSSAGPYSTSFNLFKVFYDCRCCHLHWSAVHFSLVLVLLLVVKMRLRNQLIR